MTLRQLCNVSFIAQAETKVEEGEYERWLAKLRSPIDVERDARPDLVQGQLLDFMPIAEGRRG